MTTARFTGLQVLVLIGITLAGVLCSVTVHFPLVIGFIPGFFMLILLCMKNNIPLKVLLPVCLEGINKTKIVIIILLLVSFLLPSWYLSGTVGQMVTVSLYYLTPSHFFVLSFLSALVFSMILGTSIGTLSSIGVPIMGTAAVLHLPLEIAAGALISGAFVGDRTSPFSSSHQLLAYTVEIPVKRQFKAMFPTTVAAVAASVVFYSTIDLHSKITKISPLNHLHLMELSMIEFVPPLILLLLVLFRISIIYAFLSSILTAVFIAAYHGTGVIKIMDGLWYGINGIGGGFIHMYQLLLFLALAGAYNGVLEKYSVIQPFLDKWLQNSRSLLGDSLKAIAASMLISLIAANQTLPIILTGRSFLPHWKNKYSKEELARVMGDSTCLFPGIVPWSVFTIMCSTIVGVPVTGYLPFAIFQWILPLLTLVVSFIKQIRKSHLFIDKGTYWKQESKQ